MLEQVLGDMYTFAGVVAFTKAIKQNDYTNYYTSALQRWIRDVGSVCWDLIPNK